jgi:hypothetical protein
VKQDQLIRTIEIRDRSGRAIGSKDVVTYAGLLAKAHDEGLARVKTTLVQIPSEDNGRTAIAKAEVQTGKGLFEALGDASPENVNAFIVPHLIRMAETRAKARALRDAVNIGVISFEELDGEEPAAEASDPGSGASPARDVRNGNRLERGPQSQGRQNGASSLMTEPQRRYLFRLLAAQGFEGPDAHEELKQRFAVKALTDITKVDAASMIDRLLKDAEVAKHGPLER